MHCSKEAGTNQLKNLPHPKLKFLMYEMLEYQLNCVLLLIIHLLLLLLKYIELLEGMNDMCR